MIISTVTMKSLSIFAFLLVVLPLHAFAAGPLGGYKPIDNINDPEVQEIGKFAVSEYNKESNMSLIFVEVVKGEQQVVEGMNYKLNVVAKEGGVRKIYEAIVWEKKWENFKKLVSFKPIAAARGPIPGGWQPIKDIKDPEVQKIGEFAVSEYNKESNSSLIFVEVVKGEQQVVSGMKYKLNVVAKEGGVRKNYEAIVWVKKWENFRKLVSFKPIAAARGPIPGGWQTIKDIKDPEVQKMGEFAVSEYNKESNSSLIFVEVVKGEQQVVAGMKYRLLVAAKKDGARKYYSAVVWVKTWENFQKLLSFKPLLG